ncbi:MAG: FAD-dependent oxidoreductase [Kosmotogaceae bacterium]|nr:FAD-dependent oxidoreductase [Kosmotogaceae bacterium]
MSFIEKDLVIVGSGISGIHAALAASRRGLEVLLVERNGSVGGISTIGLCNPFMRFWLGGEFLVSGIFGEILVDLHERGGILRNSFDSEILKIVFLEKLRKAGVSLALHSLPTEVVSSERIIEEVSFISSSGAKFTARAKMFLDSTGDASLAKMAGATLFSGNMEGAHQASTLMFTMSNINFERIREDVSRRRSNFFKWVTPDSKPLSVAGYFEEIEKARNSGFNNLHDYFFFIELPGEDRVSINTTHSFDRDPVNPFELSQSVFECSEQIDQLFAFSRKYVRGFEESRIEKIADDIGIRESRRVKGRYVFTGEDVRSHRKFYDGVVKATYGIDIHSPETQKITPEVRESVPLYSDYYEIPIRALISCDFDNLYMAGRCFSSDFEGQSAGRIMPTSAGMGQAIGIASAISFESGRSITEISRDEIDKDLHRITVDNSICSLSDILKINYSN